MRNRRELRSLRGLLKKVKLCEEKIKNLGDEELAALTDQFRARYRNGESLDQLLPEAFAVVITADERILGKHPYDVQIMAGIALHQGHLAEMNTGEGKTLAATMPLYLNALTGRPCILVTSNDYLAIRDAEELRPVYEFLGMTVSHPPKEGAEKQENDARKEMYSANIIYMPNGTLGFDYLFNNLIKNAKERFIHDMYYAIIDEADAILLDAAIMPLVVSGVPRVQSNLYSVCNFFVSSLAEDIDYIEEDGAVWLTEKGVRYAEKFFGIDNYYGRDFFEINRHVTLALRANVLLEKNKDYMVTNDEKREVMLFDAATGRLMPGVKLRGGMHQAIEAKEEVEITQEYRTVASVTFQNLFMMFEKFAGMSGTLVNNADELFDTYHKKVVVIPPNRPLKRVDLRDRYFVTAREEFMAAVKMTIEAHRREQPVLIILNTATDTEVFSRLLMTENIPHNVLNANNAFWEAEIIKGAGQLGAVTVATTMAGRGTDIKLGEGVKELGGLTVIGVGRMPNVRSERQARGRAGRQGDPGVSRYFASLEDDIVGAEGNEKLEKIIAGKKKISRFRLKKIINSSQSFSEESGQQSRNHSVSYDKVLQRQRDFIYATRNNLLDGERIEDSRVIEIAEGNIDRFLNEQEELTWPVLNRFLLDNISYTLDEQYKTIDISDRKAVKAYLISRVQSGLTAQRDRIGDEESYEQFVREATLKAVDDEWVELIDYLEQLQSAVSGRASAQRNVLFEYHDEAFELYGKIEHTAKRKMIRNILLSDVGLDRKMNLSIVYP